MVLIPVSRSNALWWHMGSTGDQPAMQIVGDLNVTNICKYNVVVMGAKLPRPKAIGHAMVRAHDSNVYGSEHHIPQGGISDLRFDFFLQPPVSEAGKPFKADVAIIDQFGNEHWLKGLEFPYIRCIRHLTLRSSRTIFRRAASRWLLTSNVNDR